MYKRILLAALIALIVLVVVCAGCRKNPDTPTEPSENETSETTQTTNVEGITDPTGSAGEEETVETESQSQEQETQSTEQETQKPDQNHQSSGQDNQPSNQETRPDTQETEPPTVDVSMGVVGSDDDSDLDEEVPDLPDSEENKHPDSTEKDDVPKPTEKPENNDQNDSQVVDKNFDLTKLDYEGFHALSGEDQKKIISMFGSTEDFMKWYKAVAAIYQAEHPEIEINGQINGWELGK